MQNGTNGVWSQQYNIRGVMLRKNVNTINITLNTQNGGFMQNNMTQVKIKLQIGLNQRLYDSGKISYDMYSKANEILISRLASCKDYRALRQ